MRFIKPVLTLLATLSLVSCQKKSISDCVPEYKVIVDFSKKIKKDSGLRLSSYGVNNFLPDDYEIINGIANFNATYFLSTKKEDLFTLHRARALLVSVTESFRNEINANEGIRSELDEFPISSNRINVGIYFKDANQIDLGQGICQAHLSHGKIRYERYDIQEYTGKFPAIGTHYTVHEESYEEALEKVKKQGLITYYNL